MPAIPGKARRHICAHGRDWLVHVWETLHMHRWPRKLAYAHKCDGALSGKEPCRTSAHMQGAGRTSHLDEKAAQKKGLCLTKETSIWKEAGCNNFTFRVKVHSRKRLTLCKILELKQCYCPIFFSNSHNCVREVCHKNL